jgi:hypothetical protein
MEINKDHPMLIKLNKVRKFDSPKASLIAR